MKKFLAILLCLMIFLSVSCFAADREVTVLIDGETLVTDTPPQLISGRTMLPMRAIFEAFDANVTWMGEDELIFATKGDMLVVLKIGAKEMSVQRASEDMGEIVTLDVAPFLYNERTMVPARAIAEALGADVDWIDQTSTVVIKSQNK
ncbi:MAG: copper amine oxidase N-terminal domain-containing protein [Clostridia bacterium]|nr:copper amine oxidase N-terminal domain-containing protein [Clostridia bacterium]